ncbi:MAG: T9SS type A sorting domain-containing protein, partial [Bacteroidales bacterium]|nr:T9SS type A sorting domain-containing protein [Bacteroidales bacterium]
RDTSGAEVWGISPLIKSASVYPNPTNGSFTVEIILRENAEVNLKLFDLTYGKMVNEHTEKGLSTCNINYGRNNLHKGAYVLTVTAGKERRQIKIIVQ